MQHGDSELFNAFFTLVGGTTSVVRPESELPAPKEQLRQAVIRVLSDDIAARRLPVEKAKVAVLAISLLQLFVADDKVEILRPYAVAIVAAALGDDTEAAVKVEHIASAKGALDAERRAVLEYVRSLDKLAMRDHAIGGKLLQPFMVLPDGRPAFPQASRTGCAIILGMLLSAGTAIIGVIVFFSP